jgi:hypothetical protein
MASFMSSIETRAAGFLMMPFSALTLPVLSGSFMSASLMITDEKIRYMPQADD